jgi:uncharacterized protein
VDDLVSATLALDNSYLAVQGPPGTGKTYRAARMVVAALDRGDVVGITAFSHAAVQNLLRDIEEFALETGSDLRAVYKGDDFDSPHGFTVTVSSNQKVLGDYNLIAGTAWLFAAPQLQRRLSHLFVDEAGQLSIASTVAAATSTTNLVLLGDPQQLPQVTQAQHPRESGASSLEYLLEGADTMPAERGVLLEESWRMHPSITDFVSERSYEDRLRSKPACRNRAVVSGGTLHGAGLRSVPVAHDGRSQSSDEEAATIAALCAELLDDGVVIDEHGEGRPLQPADILVVAPYNMAVNAISALVPTGVRVGTVDRFQGQEAPVVFFAMTSSSGEDIPRGLDFLFNRNRLNVAVSRAQCLAVVVYSPRLLDTSCRTIEALELVDGVCRFVEMAEPVSAESLVAV